MKRICTKCKSLFEAVTDAPDEWICGKCQKAIAAVKKEGLYKKFNVYRTDGQSEPGCKHEKCRYFVLDLDHDEFANTAILAYVSACKTKYPQLAIDLLKQIGFPNVDLLTITSEITITTKRGG